jgi:hypothetical protein
VFLFSNEPYCCDWPNSPLLVIEPVLFINLISFGRFRGKIGDFGRNRPEKRTLLSIGKEVALLAGRLALHGM